MVEKIKEEDSELIEREIEGEVEEMRELVEGIELMEYVLREVDRFLGEEGLEGGEVK